MKRTPLRPGKPLRRSAPLPAPSTPMKRTRRLKSGTPPKARGKSKRFADRRDPAYCEWIRTRPCVVAGNPVWASPKIKGCWGGVECCHVRTRAAGGDDAGNTFPACRRHHKQQHDWGIVTFQAYYSLDLAAIAKQLEARWVLRDFGGADPTRETR